MFQFEFRADLVLSESTILRMFFSLGTIFLVISTLGVNCYQDYSEAYYPYSYEYELYQPSKITPVQEQFGYESKNKKRPSRGSKNKQATLGITPSQAALIGLVMKLDISFN